MELLRADIMTLQMEAIANSPSGPGAWLEKRGLKRGEMNYAASVRESASSDAG